MTTLKANKVGSIDRLRKNLKKKGGGAGYLFRIPTEDSVVVRFLTEPTEWVMFYEHFDPMRKFFPCTGSDDGCPGCAEGVRAAERYLGNALNTDDNKVVPLCMAKTLATSLLRMYDKYSTMMDRDYDLSRTGEGLDTEYTAIPEQQMARKVAQYDLLDLMSVLEEQLPEDSEEDDDEDDEDEQPVAAPRKAAPRKAAPRKAASPPRPAIRRRIARNA